MTQSLTQTDKLFQAIRQDILRLALAPDTPLRLPVLSQRYGVSQTPLRDCLTRLATERLVVPEHNKGFRVAPLTREDLVDLEHSRSVVEGALFLEAIKTGDDAWEATLVGSFHHLSKVVFPSVLSAPAELALWTKHHDSFHKALTSAASSPRLFRFRDQLGDQLGRYHVFIQNGLRDLAETAPDRAAKAAAAFSRPMELANHEVLFDHAMKRRSHVAQAAFTDHGNLSIRAYADLMLLLPPQTPVAVTLARRPEARP